MQQDRGLANRMVAAAREHLPRCGGRDFVIAIREMPHHNGRSAWMPYPLPIGMGVAAGGVVVLRVSLVGDRWGVSPSPTLDARWRRAARYACWKVEREGLQP
jgi:hypothetical protein